MKKKDVLTNLINSLNPNEQRNFKLYSNMQGGDKAYMKLYDVLEGKADYDATALSKQLNISKSLLAEKKNYLSHVLLLSLRNFQKETPEVVGRRNVDEALLMLGRRQFSYALGITEKALAKAGEIEHFEIIGQLLKIKARCLSGLETNFDTAALMVEHKRVLACEAELFEISLLQIEMNRIEIARNSDPLHEVMENKLMSNGVEKLHSLRAQIEWFDIMVRCNHILFPNETMYKLCLQETKHYLKHPEVKIIDPVSYVKSFLNLAAAEHNLSNFKGALATIRKFEQAVNDPSIEITPIKKASLKYFGTMFSAGLLRIIGRNAEAFELIKKCYVGRQQRPLSEQYSVIFELSLTLFNLGKTDEATATMEELLRAKDDARTDLQQAARYLTMMIQLDLGNYQLIPYAVKAAKAWLKHKKMEAMPDVKLFLTNVLAVAKAPALERKHEWARFKKLADEGTFDRLDVILSIKRWLHTKTNA